MKKTLWMAVAVVVMCLISCENGGAASDNGKQATTTEQTVDSQSASTGQAVPNGLTGDLEQDATLLAERSIDISRKMIDGNDHDSDSQELQQLIDAAKDYYQSKNMRDDFAIALNEKMSKGVSELAKEMKK